MTVMSQRKAISKHDVNIGMLGDHMIFSSLIYLNWMQNGLHCSPDLSLFVRRVLSITEIHGGKTKLLCPIYPGFFYLLLCSSFSIPFSNRVGVAVYTVCHLTTSYIFCFLQTLYQNFLVIIKTPIGKKRLCDKTNLTTKCEQWKPQYKPYISEIWHGP